MGSKGKMVSGKGGVSRDGQKFRSGITLRAASIPVDVMAHRRGRLARILAAMARKGQRRPTASD